LGDEGSKCQLSDIIEKSTIRQGQVTVLGFLRYFLDFKHTYPTTGGG
jgi:hypothetical protein